jgi:hypothetical protein
MYATKVDEHGQELTPEDAAEGLRLGTRNLADYGIVMNTLSGGEADERDGLVMFAGVHAYPGTHTNGIIRVETALSAEESLVRADRFFGTRNRSYTVWIRDEADADLEAAVVARGFELREPKEGMGFVVHVGPFDHALNPVHPDAEVRSADDPEVARDYVRVLGEAFGMTGLPVEVVAKLFMDPKVFEDPRLVAHVAYIDGTPVSGCLGFVSSGYAGIYAGGTLPAARGKGLVRACATHAAEWAYGQGPRLGGGQATEEGAPVWAKMGFVTVAYYRRYIGRPTK